MDKEIDPRVLIAVVVVFALAVLGVGWKFLFRSRPNMDPSSRTMPVEGIVRAFSL